MDKKTYMNFTKGTLEKFKREYRYAILNDVDVFVFNSKRFQTTFAKYVIEYLEDKFKEKSN